MRSIALFALLSSLCLAMGCRELPPQPLGQLSQAAVYDKDDRTDTDQHPDAKLKQLAAAVAVQVTNSRINRDDKSDAVTLGGDDLTTRISKSSDYDKKPLCASEPFRNDPAPGGCTAFLIGPRLMATAGHCVSKTHPVAVDVAQTWCNYRQFVFGFKKGASLTDDHVYKCQRVLVHGYTTSPVRQDYALFQLKRDVKGVTPLSYELKPVLQKADPLAIIGHPHGIWQKIASGGTVTDPRTGKWDYFKTTLDTMPGNSGSPVFSTKSYKVIGIHVRGARPVYKLDSTKSCNLSNVYTDGNGRQSENYLTELLGKACKADADCDATQACEKGRCYLRTVDLQIASLSLSQSSASPGQRVTLTATIKNAGNADVTRPFQVGLWWSANSTLCLTCGQDRSLSPAQVYTKGVKAGASFQLSFGFEVKAPFKEGKQYVGIGLDQYRTSIKDVSHFGDIPETDEDGNRKGLEFTVTRACTSDCTQESGLRCHGKKIQICSPQSPGCLRWQDKETCPDACEAGQCKASCLDQCKATDAPRCRGNDIEECKKRRSGCLAWQATDACASPQICVDGQCKAAKKKRGEACAANDQCESGACAQGLCTTPCTTATDCQAPSRWCEGGACVPLPKGKCVDDADCVGGNAQCREFTCKPLGDEGPAPGPDAGPATEPAPPTDGCGCQSQRPFDAGISFGLLWLLAMLALRREAV